MLYRWDFLESLQRFGFDKRSCTNLSECGMLSCSERNCDGGMIKCFDFIDAYGVPNEWIQKIDRIEEKKDVVCFHVIHNGMTKLGDEFVVLCYDCSSDSSIYDAYNKLQRGVSKCFRYYPDTGKIRWGKVHFRVMGGLFDLDFKDDLINP